MPPISPKSSGYRESAGEAAAEVVAEPEAEEDEGATSVAYEGDVLVEVDGRDDECDHALEV